MCDTNQIKRVNDQNFQEQVINCSIPALVVFEKNYWGAAHIMKPIIENIAFMFANKIKVFRYDLDENSTTSDYYRIENNNTLTILVINNGNVMYKTGVISKEDLKNIINSCLINNVNQ